MHTHLLMGSLQDFASHMLNRDTWSDKSLSRLIGSKFIFWQVHARRSIRVDSCSPCVQCWKTSTDGQECMNIYLPQAPHAKPPWVAILDPRTGELLHSWCPNTKGLKAETVREKCDLPACLRTWLAGWRWRAHAALTSWAVCSVNEVLKEFSLQPKRVRVTPPPRQHMCSHVLAVLQDAPLPPAGSAEEEDALAAGAGMLLCVASGCGRSEWPACYCSDRCLPVREWRARSFEEGMPPVRCACACGWTERSMAGQDGRPASGSPEQHTTSGASDR